MNKSEEIKDLAAALCKAQSEMSGAKKKAANPFFKSKYANLEEIINCAKDALSDNGLSISQSPFAEEGTAGVTTLLMHNSGQWLEGKLLLKCTKNDPQGLGSAITYARRYAYPTYTAPKKAAPVEKTPVEATPEAPKKTTPNFTAAFALCADLAALEVKFNSAGCQKFSEDVNMIDAYTLRKKALK